MVVKAQRRRPYQMSKFVCNVAKFKGGQLYGMDIHIQRKTENHSNKDIDLERSKLNYELVNGFQNQHYFTAVKNRIEQGYLGQKQLLKDATVAVGVLVSSDKKFFEELTELKTERAIREKTDNATKYARAFLKERENEFIELYHSLKEFGEKHVATVLEKLQDLVSKLNTEKRNELARQEKQRKIELEKKHQNNLFALYGGDSNLYQLLNYGKSNYEFKENGELSFYVALKNKQGEIKFLWGMKFQNEIKNFKINEIVRLNSSKIEKLSSVRQKQYLH